MSDARRYAPATARNRDPILDVLRRYVPARARVLEIASGSGEHAMYFAPRLDVASWQPTDPDPASRASIDAWRTELGDARILPAIHLDVTELPWPSVGADVVTCINMIHIAPYRACEALFEGAAGVLVPGGILYLYGPYRREGRHTAPSNEAFDESLRARDPRWGVRDLEAVCDLGIRAGMEVAEVVSMPANNLSVVFRVLSSQR